MSAVAPLPTPDVPTVCMGPDLHRVVSETVDAMCADPNVFQRAGSIVHVTREKPTSGHQRVERSSSTPTIRIAKPAYVRERISKFVRVEKWNERKQQWTHAVPPDELVASVVARGQWPFRVLNGVIDVPTIRPDGSILQRPGYDETTGLLYLPSVAFAPIDDCPTASDAAKAVADLREVVCDFPFASPTHESAWLAMVLTMAVRPAIDGCCPMFAVDASTRGSGKGKVADAAACIAYGDVPAKTSIADTDEEMRKRLTSMLIAGNPLAFIDNVTGRVGSDALDSIITTTRWSDRILGASDMVSVPNRMLVVVTGNNLEFAQDTTRRTLPMRLESPVENPENRTGFKHPQLLSWVLEHRARLVSAALTVVRHWFVSGEPKSAAVRTWGSFEGWSSLIPHVLVHLGLPDPMGTRVELESVADTDKASLATIIDGIDAAIRGSTNLDGGITAKQLETMLWPNHRGMDPENLPPEPAWYDDMREALEQITNAKAGHHPKARQIGDALRHFRKRVVGGRMLDNATERGKSARWLVIQATLPPA